MKKTISFLMSLKFAADCGNHWFRELYRFGVWIPGAEGEQTISCSLWTDRNLTNMQFTFGMGVPIPCHLELEFAGLPITAKEGYQALARLCAMRRLHLFRVKPKLHMHDHVSRLGSNTFQF